jgi:hypothetical protein
MSRHAELKKARVVVGRQPPNIECECIESFRKAEIAYLVALLYDDCVEEWIGSLPKEDRQVWLYKNRDCVPCVLQSFRKANSIAGAIALGGREAVRRAIVKRMEP